MRMILKKLHLNLNKKTQIFKILKNRTNLINRLEASRNEVNQPLNRIKILKVKSLFKFKINKDS